MNLLVILLGLMSAFMGAAGIASLLKTPRIKDVPVTAFYLFFGTFILWVCFK